MEDRHRDRSHGQIIAGAQVAVGLGAGTVRRPPIRVNAVPGFIDTPWWAAMPDDARQEFFNQTAQALPVGRIATADDIAQVVVLAATNPNTTGTTSKPTAAPDSSHWADPPHDHVSVGNRRKVTSSQRNNGSRDRGRRGPSSPGKAT